jgi:hypothetical protein
MFSGQTLLEEFGRQYVDIHVIIGRNDLLIRVKRHAEIPRRSIGCRHRSSRRSKASDASAAFQYCTRGPTGLFGLGNPRGGNYREGTPQRPAYE